MIPVDEGDLFGKVRKVLVWMGGVKVVKDRVGVDKMIEGAGGFIARIFGVEVVVVGTVFEISQATGPVEFGERNAVDVFGGLEEVVLSVDPFGFVAALEEGAGATMAAVEVHGVGGADAAHEVFDVVAPGLVEEEVVRGRGEAVGDELDFVLE